MRLGEVRSEVRWATVGGLVVIRKRDAFVTTARLHVVVVIMALARGQADRELGPEQSRRRW